MNKILLTTILLSTILGCSKKDNSSDVTADKDKPKSDSAIVYETGEFLITPKTIGNARLGQTIKDFKETFKDYQITTVPVWNYCVDGGGDGLLVSRDKEPLIFVWTMQGNDSIHSISVMSDKFHTKSGIRPYMTAGQLLKYYPTLTVQRSMLCEGTEVFGDKLGLVFEFASSDSTTVGFYKDYADMESKPVDTTKKVTRIFIMNRN
jgi:hypothetical protein